MGCPTNIFEWYEHCNAAAAAKTVQNRTNTIDCNRIYNDVFSIVTNCDTLKFDRPNKFTNQMLLETI